MSAPVTEVGSQKEKRSAEAGRLARDAIAGWAADCIEKPRCDGRSNANRAESRPEAYI